MAHRGALFYVFPDVVLAIYAVAQEHYAGPYLQQWRICKIYKSTLRIRNLASKITSIIALPTISTIKLCLRSGASPRCPQPSQRSACGQGPVCPDARCGTMTQSFDPMKISYVATLESLRHIHPKPMSRASGKVLRSLAKHCRAILARSTFCIMGTQGPEGADVSPRGDPAGFVRVLDDRHLLLPDRIGNNRFDSFANLFANPRLGLLFLVPGMAETLRINGTARITDDAALLAHSERQGRVPKVGLLVEVKEAYLHCAKAINRAALWDPTKHIDRAQLPTYAEMLADQVLGLTREESERQGEEMARRGMY